MMINSIYLDLSLIDCQVDILDHSECWIVLEQERELWTQINKICDEDELEVDALSIKLSET